MNNTPKQLSLLLQRYEEGIATLQDMQELENWYASFEDQPDLLEGLDGRDRLRIRDHLFERIEKHTRPQVSHHPPKQRQVSLGRFLLPFAAACVAVFILIGTYWFSFRWNDRPDALQEAVVITDLPPGSHRATLTGPDGSHLELDGHEQGIVVSEDGIRYNGGEQLITGLSAAGPGNVTLTTPRGGTYQVTLPDGSNIWLNAASSVTYSPHFAGETRNVTLVGEAYFEIARDVSRPFIVNTKGQRVEVLGTQFNISAYEDERTTTTLVSGAVQVSVTGASNTDAAGTRSVRLVPGQQAILNDRQLTIQQADTEVAAAWKNGDFIFRNTPVKKVLAQIGRWYDADIDYQDDIGPIEFGGTISRNKNISEVLRVLELTGAVRFNIVQDTGSGKGRRVIVMK